MPIDPLTRDEAMVRATGFVGGGRCRLVFTPNPEIIVAAQRDPGLRRILRSADLSLADGVGVAWAARRAGRPVPERVPGVDFAGDLLGWAAERGVPVYFLGTKAGVVGRAAAAAAARYPGLAVAGWHDGFFPLSDSPRVAAAVAGSGARLCLVGMGAPREQRFLAAERDHLGVDLAVAAGGTLDVLGGVARLAPAPVRRLGLEWLWRLVRQPSRLRRQLALPVFAWTVLTAGARLCDDANGLDPGPRTDPV